ncbi:MAG: hypothetical protein ABI478_05390 [Propionivibrio sp.]
MNTKHLLLMAMLFQCGTAVATDYIVDFSRVTALESIRPLVKGCTDLDAMELYRSKMESIANLEDMRATLSAIGLGLFSNCPDGITGAGIAAVKKSAAASVPGYGVDFTRIKDFESLRPLVKGCADFAGLEQLRDRLKSAANLNDMAATLKDIGFGVFDGCPAGITGDGITSLK